MEEDFAIGGATGRRSDLGEMDGMDLDLERKLYFENEDGDGIKSRQDAESMMIKSRLQVRRVKFWNGICR